ncbi:MAG: hypothetical protein H6540_04220 [Bacteroidales bacterium]|nr:hypothetical protein [Bacteroidales bacterium]MCB9013072.1 hypothetical protein [Bacteroidales bacterium]
MKTFLLISSMFLALQNISAQNGQRLDKLQAEKIAFFTEELSLTKTEAEKFWPVYNDYSNRRDKINQDRKALYQYIDKNSSFMSEQEVKDALAKFILYQKQETELLETFNRKFLEILPPAKVMKIYVTENKFKVYILRLIKDNRQIPSRDY